MIPWSKYLSGQGSEYDEHRRGASLPKTFAVPDFVDPVQLTNNNGPAVGTDGLQSGCHIASPGFQKPHEEKPSIQN
ncbi:hypothetical protein INS49_006095 [Diaporthe citri]|uniref:uncharacterized protein n=1 Tax=Diaporthe citri TaxID=83186 RepID=UPI001C818334|nr:uncharacterized protein INS49_006095 [Diaporthe citri]KAG6364494.1 hypothetical protein INS49_006095 [Diaporthe citri]